MISRRRSRALLHGRFVVLFKVEGQEIVPQEQFELVDEKVLLLLGLRLVHTKVEVDSSALLKSVHGHGKQGLSWVLHGSLHVLVVSEGAARHDDPFRIETALEASLELVQSSLEENLLCEHIITVQVNLAIIDLRRLGFLRAWSPTFTELGLQAGLDNLDKLDLLADMVP